MPRTSGTPPLLATLGLVLLAVGCRPTPEMLQSGYPPRSRIGLAETSRCDKARCRCRPLDSNDEQGERQIADDHKRFELRLPRSTSAIWVDIQDRGTYYKAPNENEPACFYVDLPPGDHALTLHAENRDTRVGLHTGLEIYEYGEGLGSPNWYESFRMRCGHAASRCTRTEVEAWKQAQERLPRGVLDPCGSVMVRKVRFSGKRAERFDQQYQVLTVKFDLRVYEFAPYRPPGASECTGPTKNR